MSLEEALSADPVGRSDDRAGTALEVLHHPCSNVLEVSRQVELSDGALALVGPEDLVRTTQGHSHYDALAGRSVAAGMASRQDGCCDSSFVGGRGSFGFDLFRGFVLA